VGSSTYTMSSAKTDGGEGEAGGDGGPLHFSNSKAILQCPGGVFLGLQLVRSLS